MYKETKLSEEAQMVEDALRSIPPKYDVADKLLFNHDITAEELSKIAVDLLDYCFDEQFDYRDHLAWLVDDNTLCSNIYQIMQYLFKKGYDPNVTVNGNVDCAMNEIRYLDYPEGIAPKLMRLFMENGADPNLVAEGESVFEVVDRAVSYDEYMSRSSVYCWLVLMAYGGRLGEEKEIPLTMHDGRDVSIFKRYEDYPYYEIIPTEQIGYRWGCWQMHIYEAYEDERILVASYGDLNGKRVEKFPSELIRARNTTSTNDNKKEEVEKRSNGVPISEEDFLSKIAKMYSEYTVEGILHHMELGFRYNSFWVFEEITSAKDYVDYITGKVQAIKKAKAAVKTKMMHIKGSDKPCLVLEQQSGAEPACLTVERSKNGLIAKMDMMPSSFYELV